MLFQNKKIVFIHIPKTGGNFFTKSFIHESSDTLISELSRHDGINRFAVRGEFTQRKHQSLLEYVEVLGETATEYEFYSIVRHPLDRLMSLYYSPGRKMVETPSGETVINTLKDPIDLEEFSQFIAGCASTVDLLDLRNASLSSDEYRVLNHVSGVKLRLMDFKNLSNEVAAFAQNNGFSTDHVPAKKTNASDAIDYVKLNSHQFDDLKQIISSSRHVMDLNLFNE